MDKLELEHYKQKLIRERKKVVDTLKHMERNETINSNSEMSSELSFYDNHPSDTATELYDKERGLAFKENEISIIKKIDDALKNIDSGKYGVCKICGKVIVPERLQFIPYTDYCVQCQTAVNEKKLDDRKQRPIEEEVLGFPFGYGYNASKDIAEFDAEDSYQSVERFNSRENIAEYDIEGEEDGYVEAIEKISNEQYINQLPD